MEMTKNQDSNIQNIGHDVETVNNVFDYCKDNVNNFLSENPKIASYIFGGLVILGVIGSVIYEKQKIE